MFCRSLESNGIAGIRMTHDTAGRVVPETPAQSRLCVVATVGENRHTCVLAKANTHAAAMVEAHPGGSTGGVQHEIQNRPIGHGLDSGQDRRGSTPHLAGPPAPLFAGGRKF